MCLWRSAGLQDKEVKQALLHGVSSAISHRRKVLKMCPGVSTQDVPALVLTDTVTASPSMVVDVVRGAAGRQQKETFFQQTSIKTCSF